MAEDVAALHRRDEAVEQMQIGAADGRERDFDDGVARVQDARIRDSRDAYVIGAVPADSFHPRGWPEVVGTSPASTSCLKRRRSSRISVSASRPKSRATAAPTLPPGGLYCRWTVTRVPRPAAAASKFTEPALMTSAPSRERQPITWLGTSLWISASHSTTVPAG